MEYFIKNMYVIFLFITSLIHTHTFNVKLYTYILSKVLCLYRLTVYL